MERTEHGWGHVESSTPITGICLTETPILPGRIIDISLVYERDFSTQWIIPLVVQNDQWDTSVLVNGPGHVDFTFVDRQRHIQHTAWRENMPYSHALYKMADLFVGERTGPASDQSP